MIPSSTVVEVLDRALSAKKAKVYLIEGFPKNKENAEVWNKKLIEKYHLKHVFYFHCSLDVLEKRLVSRGKSSGRADDQLDVVK